MLRHFHRDGALHASTFEVAYRSPPEVVEPPPRDVSRRAHRRPALGESAPSTPGERPLKVRKQAGAMRPRRRRSSSRRAARSASRSFRSGVSSRHS